MADTGGKLPVFQTVGNAISYSLKNLLLMVRITWLWMVIVIAVGTATLLGVWRLAGTVAPDGAAAHLPFFLGIGIAASVCVLAIYSVAVAWHRALLLGERPGWLHLRFGRHELGYLGYALAVLLISSLGLVVWAAVLASGATLILPRSAAAILSTAVFVVGYVAMVLLIGRLQLVMPGVAVGDRRMSLRRSFDLTSGNSWRIFGGFMLIAFLNGIISVFSSILESTPDSASLLAVVGLAVIVLISTIVVAFITLSYMSYCYWFFVPSPQEGDLA